MGEDTAYFAVFLLEEEAKIEIGGRLPEHAHLEFSGEGESCGFALGAKGDFRLSVTAIVGKWGLKG